MLIMCLFLAHLHSTRVVRSRTSTVTVVFLLHMLLTSSWAKKPTFMELAFISVPQILNHNLDSQEPPQSGLDLLFLAHLPLLWLTGNLSLYLHWRRRKALIAFLPPLSRPITINIFTNFKAFSPIIEHLCL